MYFDLRQASISRSVFFWQLFPPYAVKFWKAILFSAGLTCLVIAVSPELLNFSGVPLILDTSFFAGLAWILIPLGLAVLFAEIYGEYHLKEPAVVDQNNLAERLDYEAASIVARALAYSAERGEVAVSSDTLLLAVLNDPTLKKLFYRIGLDGQAAAKNISSQIGIGDKLRLSPGAFRLGPTPLSEDVATVFQDADKLRTEHGGHRITAPDILTVLFDRHEIFKRLILDIGLNGEDLDGLGYWYEQMRSFKRQRAKFWELDNLLRKPPIGKDWIYGFSWYLNHFARNLTDQFAETSGGLRLTSRKKEMDQLEQILSRAGENNVLLVGEPGVGKKHIVEDLAELIAQGKALPALNYKKVYELNVPLIAASSKEPTEVQNTLTRLLDEAVKAGNVVLVIDELHNFIGEMGGMGRLDVTEILLPYLRLSNFQVVATTDPVNFHKYIESRGELMDVFEKVSVAEPDVGQTMRIVQEALPDIEYRARVTVTYGALKGIVRGGEKFVRTVPFPEKAFDLLSEVIAYAATQKHTFITIQDVNEVISRKTGIPVGPITGGEKDTLMNLEELMRKELIGQERAVQVVASTMRRLRAGLGKRGKPAGVFLFVGPTGVGKTQTAKILAKTYFGSESRMLRFDMSEYQDVESLDRFLGNLRLNEPGQFVTAARENPFALILLDELEKTNKNVLNVFLQVFDEGRLTDVLGRKVSFEQHIIIATSNAGADTIRELVKEGVDPSLEKEKVIDILIQSKSFAPEFLNRFDEVVVFHPLTPDQIYQIARLGLDGLATRLAEQDYVFKPTDEIIKFIAEAGFDPQFGARPIQRAIKDKVESVIAKKILEGAVRKGEEFGLTVGELGT